MKKAILLLMLLVIPGALAMDTDYANLLGWWQLDEASGNAADSSTSTTNYLMYPSGNVNYQYPPLGNLSDYSININDGDTGYFYNAPVVDELGQTDFTMCAWFNLTQNAASSQVVGTWNHNRGAMLRIDNDVAFCMYQGASGSKVSPGFDFIDQDYYAFGCCRFNQTDESIFINGTRRDKKAISPPGGQPGSGNSSFRIGLDHSGYYQSYGSIDEVFLFNESLPDSVIYELYSLGIEEIPVPDIIAFSRRYNGSHNLTKVDHRGNVEVLGDITSYGSYYGEASTLTNVYDNMGSHEATQTLNMNEEDISFVGNIVSRWDGVSEIGDTTNYFSKIYVDWIYTHEDIFTGQVGATDSYVSFGGNVVNIYADGSLIARAFEGADDYFQIYEDLKVDKNATVTQLLTMGGGSADYFQVADNLEVNKNISTAGNITIGSFTFYEENGSLWVKNSTDSVRII